MLVKIFLGLLVLLLAVACGLLHRRQMEAPIEKKPWRCPQCNKEGWTVFPWGELVCHNCNYREDFPWRHKEKE